jgi:hypothetical protein
MSSARAAQRALRVCLGLGLLVLAPRDARADTIDLYPTTTAATGTVTTAVNVLAGPDAA